MFRLRWEDLLFPRGDSILVAEDSFFAKAKKLNTIDFFVRTRLEQGFIQRVVRGPPLVLLVC
jgi:hypothetical protein